MKVHNAAELYNLIIPRVCFNSEKNQQNAAKYVHKKHILYREFRKFCVIFGNLYEGVAYFTISYEGVAYFTSVRYVWLLPGYIKPEGRRPEGFMTRAIKYLLPGTLLANI